MKLMNNDSSPESVSSSDDRGDDIARRFAYQWSYAAIISCGVLDTRSTIAEVFCEHHEDILVKLHTGKFNGIQVKTRQSDGDPFRAGIAEAFREVMLDVGFPGFFEEDSILLDPRNWLPLVAHSDDTWTFFDAGSGGKKTLFNVCYALALHKIASSRFLPLPTFLIIDSPTKNITQDENPALVMALYETLYRLAAMDSRRTQFLLIDSHLVPPSNDALGFVDRRFGTGENGDAPPLIPYYRGP